MGEHELALGMMRHVGERLGKGAPVLMGGPSAVSEWCRIPESRIPEMEDPWKR